MYDKKVFAGNLARYMNENRLNQADIATATGASASAVSAWCRGEKTPRMDKVALLARTFGCSISDLIEDGSSPDGLTPAQRDLINLVPTLTPEELSVLASTAKALKAARREPGQ